MPMQSRPILYIELDMQLFSRRVLQLFYHFKGISILPISNRHKKEEKNNLGYIPKWLTKCHVLLKISMLVPQAAIIVKWSKINSSGFWLIASLLIFWLWLQLLTLVVFVLYWPTIIRTFSLLNLHKICLHNRIKLF